MPEPTYMVTHRLVGLAKSMESGRKSRRLHSGRKTTFLELPEVRSVECTAGGEGTERRHNGTGISAPFGTTVADKRR